MAAITARNKTIQYPSYFQKNELDAGKVMNATAGSARQIFLKLGS